MIINRREILIGSLGLGAASLALPRIAFAATPGSQRKMLFLLLRGAADGMGILAPVGDPHYERLRGELAQDYAGLPQIGGMFAFHPDLKHLSAMFAAGDLVASHAMATSYRERSHFDAQNLIENGGLHAYDLRDGWMNRLLQQMGGNAPRALGIAAAVPVALRGDFPVSSYAPSALPDADDALLARVGAMYMGDPQLHGVWEQALETREMAGDVQDKNLKNAQRAGELAARLMRGADGAGMAMMDLGGWDTHANQRGSLSRALKQLDTLLGAYKTGMGEAWSDTLVLVATEFGRTAKANGTAGTDHGTGSLALALGGAVNGGRVLADWPGLSDSALFERRDLRPTGSLEAFLAGASAEHFRLDPARAFSAMFPQRKLSPYSGLIT